MSQTLITEHIESKTSKEVVEAYLKNKDIAPFILNGDDIRGVKR